MKELKETKFPLRLDLQFFASENEEADTTEEQEETDQTQETEETQQQEKNFTQADVDAIVAKRAKQAAKKAREDAEKEYQRKSMSEEERRQQEYEDLKRENESYKAKARRAELKDHATDLLRGAGIPTRFANRLIGEDEEATEQAVKEFIADWNSELSTAVKGKLAGPTPKQPKVEKETIDKAEAAFDAAWND
ncbi:capsid assembly scaffolding protein Gp46 family protein [Bacillus sp. WLY-B-L8]|uniref:capsid assembly scaffolding protein Gp46 family protein n=1 Tax=Bacillus multifaciens TaxID=3068506 RepID=UPI0027411648|nr:DUF4355 domain-containing protein [Bacillus sp. WLY-B-L8]MDP7981030.1 DUF4355 domain-containing protein [Bacillus sp. WLY-B-L8]